VDNLFIVESPLQALVAVELSLHRDVAFAAFSAAK
jgi:hypothetical protein